MRGWRGGWRGGDGGGSVRVSGTLEASSLSHINPVLFGFGFFFLFLSSLKNPSGFFRAILLPPARLGPLERTHGCFFFFFVQQAVNSNAGASKKKNKKNTRREL